MKHVYHFNKNTDVKFQARILEWCYAQAGARKTDWDLWTKFHSGGGGNPISVDVGVKIENDEVALAFELAFNVSQIRLGKNCFLKAVNV